MTVEETCTDDKKGRTTGRGSRESIQKQGAGDTGKPCRAFVLALPSISASKAMGFLSSSDGPGRPTCTSCNIWSHALAQRLAVLSRLEGLGLPSTNLCAGADGPWRCVRVPDSTCMGLLKIGHRRSDGLSCPGRGSAPARRRAHAGGPSDPVLLHNGRHFDASVIPPEEWLHNGRHFDASVILPDEWRAYVASREPVP